MMHLFLAGLALLVVLVTLTALYFLCSPIPKPPQPKGSLTKEGEGIGRCQVEASADTEG